MSGHTRNIAKTMTNGATKNQPTRVSRARCVRVVGRSAATVRAPERPAPTSMAADDTIGLLRRSGCRGRSDRVGLRELDVEAADEGGEPLGRVRALQVDVLDGVEEVVLEVAPRTGEPGLRVVVEDL